MTISLASTVRESSADVVLMATPVALTSMTSVVAPTSSVGDWGAALGKELRCLVGSDRDGGLRSARPGWHPVVALEAPGIERVRQRLALCVTQADPFPSMRRPDRRRRSDCRSCSFAKNEDCAFVVFTGA